MSRKRWRAVGRGTLAAAAVVAMWACAATPATTPPDASSAPAGAEPPPPAATLPVPPPAASPAAVFTEVTTGAVPEPEVPAAPTLRASPGATLQLSGQWNTATIDLDPAGAHVRCTVEEPRGIRDYEVSTDPAGPHEFGIPEGNVYLRARVGPDGGGTQVADILLALDDGTRFSGAATAYPPTSNRLVVEARFQESAAQNAVAVSARVILFPSFNYSRADGIGWVVVTASIRCP